MQLVHTVRCVDVGWGVAVEEGEVRTGAGVVHASFGPVALVLSSGATWTSGTNCKPADTGAVARVKNPAVAKVSTTSAIAVNRVNSLFKICPPLCILDE